MTKGKVWLQVFLSALAALLQNLQNAPTHQIVQTARATADEAMQHIHPMVYDDEHDVDALVAKGEPAYTGAMTQSGEDEMERARRQGTRPLRPSAEEEAEAERAQRA